MVNINTIINPTIVAAIMVIITLPIPIAFKSAMTPLISNALPKLSVLDNLHTAIVRANAKIIATINPSIVAIQCWNMAPKTTMIIIGIII